ncbi:putative inhibitor of apoptosis [Saccostrea echinata]|uniref:putative inhibitor of apoptosis n=1 Tax=Saccostrea echinata TaxID=191078 RepID=UPI002A803063|nr:putative inhibitor of apoptosis [Saccostrea echinata]
MQRLASFAKYKNEKDVFICKLSKAGFYYVGYDNAVECESCKFKSNSWTDLTDLFTRHVVHSSTCPFSHENNVKTEHSKKIFLPNTREEDQKRDRSPIRADNSGRRVDTVRRPEKDSCSINASSPKQIFQNLGIHFDRPKFPSYAVLATRIKSYATADNCFHKSPTEMAQAGFFFKGYSDHVCCFSCGGGLSEWRPEDDPWVEHAYWFPKCTFIIQNKGEAFVRHLQLIREEDERREQTEKMNGQGAFCNGGDEIDSVVFSSVLEMGYTEEQIKGAFESLKFQGIRGSVSAENIVEILMLQEDKSPPSNNRVSADNNFESITEDQPRSIESLSSEMNNTNLIDLQAVQKEYQELQDITICKVCMTEKVSIVFLPCGHIVTCADCAPAMRKCPICRGMVKGTIRAFLS